MQEIDFLKIFKRATFHKEPFPHWVINDFFDISFAQKLSNTFPKSKQLYTLTKNEDDYTQNTAYSLESDLIDNQFCEFKKVFDAWNIQKDMIIDFISDNLPPNIRNNIQEIKKLAVSRGDIRSTSPAKKINNSQLGPHCDNPNKIFAGLIYFKNENEINNAGGDLEIYQLRKDAPSRYMSSKRRIKKSFLDKYDTIKYEFNKAIFFVPTELAIHGISAREITSFDRRLINLSIGIMQKSDYLMWDVDKFSDLKYFKRKILLKKFINFSKKVKILNPLTKQLMKINLSEGIYKNINTNDL